MVGPSGAARRGAGRLNASAVLDRIPDSRMLARPALASVLLPVVFLLLLRECHATTPPRPAPPDKRCHAAPHLARSHRTWLHPPILHAHGGSPAGGMENSDARGARLRRQMPHHTPAKLSISAFAVPFGATLSRSMARPYVVAPSTTLGSDPAVRESGSVRVRLPSSAGLASLRRAWSPGWGGRGDPEAPRGT